MGKPSMEAFDESSHENCGSSQEPPGPPSLVDECTCGEGVSGCRDAIADLRDEIADLESNQMINPMLKAMLIAKHRRCIDALMRLEVKQALGRDDIEPAITYLSSQPEFRYRIMAYGIMNQNQEYTRSRSYLNALQVSRSEEQDFVVAQLIYLDYITDIENYILSPADSTVLRAIGEAANPLSGYARAIFRILTGERIPVVIPHLDSTITIRSSDAVEQYFQSFSVPSFSVYPNPANKGTVEISAQNLDLTSNYHVSVFDIYGRLIFSDVLSDVIGSIPLGESTGVYVITIGADDSLIEVKRIIRL